MSIVCGCFGSQRNTDAIKSIILDIKKQEAIQDIDPLILSLEHLLSQIKAHGEAAGASTHLEPLVSATTSASEIIDYISKEAEKMSTSKTIQKELGGITVDVLKRIGETHWIFLGLSLVACSLQRYMTMKSNVSVCMDLLEKLVELAKDVKRFKEAFPKDTKELRKPVQVIVEGLLICCHHITDSSASRYFTTETMKSQLEKTVKNIQDIQNYLTFKGVISIADQTRKSYELSPSKLLHDFKPEGIDDQITQVREKLAMEGSEPAVAVILWGHGGIGKTTLAASVINDLYSKRIDFKFIRVIIDQETRDKRAHIVKLQEDIISNLGGGKCYLSDPAAGRQRLLEVMENESCFFYIDNAVENDIKELLPQLETSNPQKKTERSDLLGEKEKSDPLKEKEKTKLRILITSRENNLKPQLNIKRIEIIEDYNVKFLSQKTGENLLKTTILQGDVKLHQQFDEVGLITEVAKACEGVPILLSVFGNHLNVKRKEGTYKDVLQAYKDVLQALQEGNVDKYSSREEEKLSKKLLFVYERMEDEEAKEAFLDICTFFKGWEWDQVAHIVGESSLQALQKKKLVNKSESNTVMVHDVLRTIGTKRVKAECTRLTNYDEFCFVKDDITKLQNIKGLALVSATSLTSLDCKHLNAMHNSLRVLQLGDWVRLDGSPCEDAFPQLRYLQIGDLTHFPFKDASKLKKLTVFCNSSKPGMELRQLPPNLKHISHQVPYRDCNALKKLPLKDLKSLERFHVGTMRSVCLPQGFKFPASLVNLELTRCKMLPKSFLKGTALQSLILDECDIECLPQGFQQQSKLTYLSLRGCTRLVKLPDGLEMLSALEELNIAGCESLSALPDVFKELSALQMLDLKGCISLHRLPDSFGRLPLRSLNLHSLSSLEELPESFGDLPSLTNLSLISCDSLQRLPKTFARLRKLEVLAIKDCSKLTLSDCPLVTDVSTGFQALPNLKTLQLINCRSVLNLPMGFGELSSLENLYVAGLPLSSLPDGFGNLKNLKNLRFSFCYKLERVSQDFQNLTSLEYIQLHTCPMLDGATMDKIVKLQHCRYVWIRGRPSTKLMERWNELKKENEEYAIYVQHGDFVQEEQRVRRVSLFRGQCIELDSTRQELIHHSSMSVSKNTTVVVMSGELHQGQLKPIAEKAIKRAKERAERDCSGQLRIIHVCTSAESDGQIPQILRLLPPGVSYAIPSTDRKRIWLIGYTFFWDKDIFLNRPDQQPFASFTADWRAEDQDSEILKIFKVENISENDIAGTSAHESTGSERAAEENEVPEEEELPDKIEEFLNFICEGKAHQTGETTAKDQFIEALENNDIHDLMNSNQLMVRMEQLEGKLLAVIMIDLHSPECKELQKIYGSIQEKGWNFEAIWIALSDPEDFGFGTYSRAIHGMPGMFLPDPKSIKLQDVKNKSPRIMIFSEEGHIVNPNALPLMMSWGADAYPFAENVVSQMVAKVHIKSSLDVLFHGMNFSTYQENKELKEIINSKYIFLYAELSCPKFKMNSMLEQFAKAQTNFEILYLGNFFGQKNDAENVEAAYENATENMPWPKLSFLDTMKFWYRCQCLSTGIDKMEEKVGLNMASLKRILQHLLDEKRWLILLDGDGVVTAHGREVVELMCRSANEEDDVDRMMKRELRESLENGKCKQVVRTYFKDEMSAYPHHPHPLMLRLGGGFYCNRCQDNVSKKCAPHERRAYECEGCDWDLCGDCWEGLAKEQVKASKPREKTIL